MKSITLLLYAIYFALICSYFGNSALYVLNETYLWSTYKGVAFWGATQANLSLLIIGGLSFISCMLIGGALFNQE